MAELLDRALHIASIGVDLLESSRILKLSSLMGKVLGKNTPLGTTGEVQKSDKPKDKAPDSGEKEAQSRPLDIGKDDEYLFAKAMIEVVDPVRRASLLNFLKIMKLNDRGKHKNFRETIIHSIQHDPEGTTRKLEDLVDNIELYGISRYKEIMEYCDNMEYTFDSTKDSLEHFGKEAKELYGEFDTKLGEFANALNADGVSRLDDARKRLALEKQKYNQRKLKSRR